MPHTLFGGAATADITPADSQFLFGYPHVRRYSTGVHDPLLSSALFLSDGKTPVVFVANDVIYISRDTARRARERIERESGIPGANVMITATHTHSGPLTADMVSNTADPIVPKTDPEYVARLENGIVAAALQAIGNVRPVQVGLGVADGSCVGTHRHDPAGPRDPEVPVLVVRDRADQSFLAVMTVCSMHPTVLHEDSTLISGDFPAMARAYLQETTLGAHCPVIYHTGPCGNQSPRHVTKANTFAEAARLGQALGQAMATAIANAAYVDDIALDCVRTLLELPLRTFPAVADAQAQVDQAAAQLETMRCNQADRREVRTAECDWFGAEETLALARAAEDGRLAAAIASTQPAEIMAARIGPWTFVGWPGEAFVEFALAVKAAQPNSYVISLANGELQGYLSTAEAVQQRWYEGMNSLFKCPDAGQALVAATQELLAKRQPNP